MLPSGWPESRCQGLDEIPQFHLMYELESNMRSTTVRANESGKRDATMLMQTRPYCCGLTIRMVEGYQAILRTHLPGSDTMYFINMQSALAKAFTHNAKRLGSSSKEMQAY